MYLKNALYIPTFKQNIFSVQAPIKNGVDISFERDNYQLIYPNEAVWIFEKKISYLSKMSLTTYILGIKY